MMKEKDLILEDFIDWKQNTDQLIQLPQKLTKKERAKFIEELYFIKDEEGKEIIISAGAMLWLYLGGNNNNDKELISLQKQKRWRNYLEELKIRHRLEIFNLKTEDFDRQKIRQNIKQ